ncbi:cell envelope integrity protein CreD [Coralloluteibacterium stylophorae]|uniref:Cell envelope integrity protein CreD n=2 Tax=Coralloluteibacterium stylophorae TaxID=1776034 RepID=A0AAP2CD60_9GAMM|nr:cell envelope integrity protein CreD [Coralloluteibacterium stylophorae]MBS7457765.1 cell envelope integrity protein CreD [Coralloluteibacterium stylophorae]
MRVMLKLLMIGALVLVLAIPLLLMRGLVHERQARGAEAAAEIARASSRPQRLVGPYLLIEAERVVRARHAEGRGRDAGEGGTLRETVYELVLPETLVADSTLTTETRRRGLFTVPLYRDALTLEAVFAVPPDPAPEGEVLSYRRTGARLGLGLGDARGIRGIDLEVDGRALQVEPGSGQAWLAEGVHARLPAAALAGGRLQMALSADLIGTESLRFVPAGSDTRVTVRGDWPHPSFDGNYLPDTRRVGDAGFEAEWRISRLASNAQQVLGRCAGAGADGCFGLEETTFGLRLVDPVDRYLMTDRAMKFGLLFLVLVFGAVFLVEALRGVAVHPVQYGLTGLALGLFFLLLLALSEHIGFGPAYLLAALACIGLVASYMGGVLGGRRRGVGFALLLALLYGLLYGLLRSETYALLVGSVALFALLAAVMFATRRLDWSRFGAGAAA